MNDLDTMTRSILAFRDSRDWKKFHTPKDMVLSLLMEATELAEHFQWQKDADLPELLSSKRELIGEELADCLYWILLMAHDFGIQIDEAFEQKMNKNAAKYPVEKATGKSEKYTAYSKS